MHLLLRRRLVIAVVLGMFGFGASVAVAAGALDVQFDVSSDWLKTHRNDPRIRILDLRPEGDYQQGHIEGAANLPIDRLFASEKGKHYIAPLDRIRVAFGGAGIDSSVLVVAYDGGEFVSSTRAFWVLEVYGHSRVVVLDGGFKAWTDMHLPVSTQEVRVQPRTFVPRISPNRLATKLSTRLAIDRPNTVIVDVRDQDQYPGEKSWAPRSGHIPSAINISGTRVFDQIDGGRHLKPIGELAALYKNISPKNTVVTYCNDGVRASATYFVLRRLGYDVANYDGAWLEWGNDMSLPIDAPAGAVSASVARPL